MAPPPRPVPHSTRSPATRSSRTVVEARSRWSSSAAAHRRVREVRRRPAPSSCAVRRGASLGGAAVSLAAACEPGSREEVGHRPAAAARRSRAGTRCAARSRGSARRAARPSAGRGSGRRRAVPSRSSRTRSMLCSKTVASRRMLLGQLEQLAACRPALSSSSSTARELGLRRRARASSATIARPK